MIQYSTVHFSPLLSNVLHHKTYHYSILVGYNNYIYYTDQQTTRTLGKYTLVYVTRLSFTKRDSTTCFMACVTHA